ncbi:MAG TPA: TetR/AcrR family transcriptional regulator [Sphingomicrobium sp.]|nr:TetR/AcrR family transcriptional regulator [Sphingomicrobium sp.]
MSTSSAHERASKSRSYRLGRRAEKQQETRRRIVEAAIELHGTIGPARTTVAEIAGRAGVQRHTYYAHFPAERDLMLACSGLAMERDPLPDPEQWAVLPPGADRIRDGLHALYDWYHRNQNLAACVFRDAEIHALTREVTELRMAPAFRLIRESLGKGLSDDERILLDLALQFDCWRRLCTSLDSGAAANLMVRAIAGAGTRGQSSSSS